MPLLQIKGWFRSFECINNADFFLNCRKALTPRKTSLCLSCIYISQLIRFARASSHVDDFNTRNKVLTAKLLRQEYRYISKIMQIGIFHADQATKCRGNQGRTKGEDWSTAK